MLIGIVVGIVFMLCLIIAFAAGYGFADQKYKEQEDSENPLK